MGLGEFSNDNSLQDYTTSLAVREDRIECRTPADNAATQKGINDGIAWLHVSTQTRTPFQLYHRSKD